MAASRRRPPGRRCSHRLKANGDNYLDSGEARLIAPVFFSVVVVVLVGVFDLCVTPALAVF